MNDVLPPPLAPAGYHGLAIERWLADRPLAAIDQVAEEVPVAMVYNGISHAVMLASPLDLECFALGFSLTEGILRHPGELYGCEIVLRADGVELQMEIAQQRFAELKQRRRNLAGRTGCGLCGAESLQQVRRACQPLAVSQQYAVAALHAALQTLPQRQRLQAITGAAHAARGSARWRRG